jgi:hypothetical protein
MRPFPSLYKPKPPRPKMAIVTINGRPAWQVVAERKEQADVR